MGQTFNSECHCYEDYSSEIYSDENTGFRSLIFQAGENYEEKLSPHHNLIFITEGEVLISYSVFFDQEVCKGDIFLVPLGTKFIVRTITKVRLLILTFDERGLNRWHKGIRHNPCNAYESNLSILKITPQLQLLINQIEQYLASNVMYPYLNNLKQKELFALFTYNYPVEQIRAFFHALSGGDTRFKMKVIECMQKKMGITEMASRLNMSTRTFSRHFIEEFGGTPRAWMQKQKAKQIQYTLLCSEFTFQDIINEYDFTDMSHFTKFCKIHYGCTPKELLKQLRKKNIH